MTEKKKSRRKSFTLEEIYQNKNFVQPKEQNLETIFEEPREAKNGLPVFTSVRKYRRYLDFDPTQGKIQKRKKNAKKCTKKVGSRGRTRSASKSINVEDISIILETLNDSSDDDCFMDTVESFSDSIIEDSPNDTFNLVEDRTNDFIPNNTENSKSKSKRRDSVYIGNDYVSDAISDNNDKQNLILSNNTANNCTEDKYNCESPNIIMANKITVRQKRSSISHGEIIDNINNEVVVMDIDNKKEKIKHINRNITYQSDEKYSKKNTALSLDVNKNICECS